MLHIKNVTVTVANKTIVDECSFDVLPSTLHVIMGPNGSGKSSLASTIMGHPAYQIQQGIMTFFDTNIIDLQPHQRSKLGIFLAFQQPLAIPGVTVFQLLKEIYYASGHEKISVHELHSLCMQHLTAVGLSEAFLDRGCNENFSGGEKKRFEIVQMLVVQPKLIVLDEIDSGLDVDALKAIAAAIAGYLKEHPEAACIVITHYRRILDYLTPDYVHILKGGNIVKTGNAALSYEIEEKGYDFV